MKKSVLYSLHALVNLLFIILIFATAKGLSGYYKESLSFNLIDSFLNFGSFLALVYVAYFWFIPQYIIKKEYWKFALGIIVIVVGFTCCFNLITLFVAKVLSVRFHVFVQGNWIGIGVYALIVAMAGTFFRLFIEWIKDSQDKIELEKQNFKSELSLLKNQLNPHFLFNTLNNIDSLISDNSKNASLALNKLAEIMRYVVYDSEKEKVSVEEELTYIQNYIELQQLRMPNKEIISLMITNETQNKQIAPMLFIPFVENAFKHTSLKDKLDNKIDVRIDIRESEIIFYCFNTIGNINKDKSSGVGLSLVRKRLDMIYKSNYNLNITSTANSFTVDLNIKLI